MPYSLVCFSNIPEKNLNPKKTFKAQQAISDQRAVQLQDANSDSATRL